MNLRLARYNNDERIEEDFAVGGKPHVFLVICSLFMLSPV
jgi:hypothetical protein